MLKHKMTHKEYGMENEMRQFQKSRRTFETGLNLPQKPQCNEVFGSNVSKVTDF